MEAKRVNRMNDIEDDILCYWKDEAGWWVYIPKCGAGVISKHKVEEHEDGTITVTPSILMHGHENGKPTRKHGYLTRGVWKECE